MVEIIPKQIVGYSPRTRIFLEISIFLFLSVLVSYFIVQQLVSIREGELTDQKELLEAEFTSAEQALEERVLDLKKTIDNFAKVIEIRKNSLNFFAFLEKNTVPEVFFTELDLKPQTHEAILSGQSTNFFSLEQQMLVLKSNPAIARLELSDIKLGSEGLPEFRLHIQFNGEVFQ
ncbi:hypothetical protein IIA94_01555 [Patescibacteria group bacterium]|nr:hypothetical protein [Patescibacteria group bacterium]